MSPPTLTVLLELQVGAEPIAGLLRCADTDLEFDGWLGLAAALEHVLEAREPDDN